MRRPAHFMISVLSMALLFCSCIRHVEIEEKKTVYLGQTPPGKEPKIFSPGTVSTGFHETDITMSPDLSEVYFTRTGLDWYSAVLCVRLNENGWQVPEMVSFSGGHSCNYPFVSPYGERIYFDSRGQTQTQSDRDIWVAQRNDEGWSVPQPLDSTVNTSAVESFAGVASNGDLYFCARYADGVGGFDLYTSRWAGTAFASPENLGPLVNSEDNDFHPYIDPDGDYIIFDSQRPGGFGGNDLYVSFRRSDGTWDPAVNMGASVNTPYSDMRPYVSPDGKYFFFCSDRTSPREDRSLRYDEFMDRIGGPGNGSQDIYWVDAGVIDELERQ